MNASEYLDTPELYALTGYARSGQQVEWLTIKGIPHRVDGKRVIVSRDHVKDWIKGKVFVSGGVNLKAIK